MVSYNGNGSYFVSYNLETGECEPVKALNPNLSANATEDIKQGMLLIVVDDNAKAYRYGTLEYGNAFAESDALKGEQVSYRKLPNKIRIVNEGGE